MAGWRGGSDMRLEPICRGQAKRGRDIIQQSKIYGTAVSANWSWIVYHQYQRLFVVLLCCCVVAAKREPCLHGRLRRPTPTPHLRYNGRPVLLLLPPPRSTIPSPPSPSSSPLLNSSYPSSFFLPQLLASTPPSSSSPLSFSVPNTTRRGLPTPPH
jgi:hypothetical protein